VTLSQDLARVVAMATLGFAGHEALQFVSYYHPRDFIQHLSAAFAREESEAAKNAIAQILVSSRMAAIGHRP
jgi:fumarate hydratase class I